MLWFLFKTNTSNTKSNILSLNNYHIFNVFLRSKRQQQCMRPVTSLFLQNQHHRTHHRPHADGKLRRIVLIKGKTDRGDYKITDACETARSIWNRVRIAIENQFPLLTLVFTFHLHDSLVSWKAFIWLGVRVFKNTEKTSIQFEAPHEQKDGWMKI